MRRNGLHHLVRNLPPIKVLLGQLSSVVAHLLPEDWVRRWPQEIFCRCPNVPLRRDSPQWYLLSTGIASLHS